MPRTMTRKTGGKQNKRRRNGNIFFGFLMDIVNLFY